MCLLLNQYFDTKKWNLGKYVGSICQLIVMSFGELGKPFSDGKAYFREKGKVNKKVWYGLLGVVIGVMVMNLPISVYTQIGVVLLIALAAKNAILIVEFARDYRAAGKSTEESAIEGGRVRLRPILMTSFAFILGTFPLVISTGAGASSRISLGIAVFAGMLMTSLVGTLFIPNFYLMMESLHERFTRKKKKDKDTEENLPAVYEEQLPMKRE